MEYVRSRSPREESGLLLRQRASGTARRRPAVRRARGRTAGPADGAATHRRGRARAEIAARGWIGVTIPRRYGGMGLGHLAKTIIIEELARVSGAMGAMAQASQLGVAKVVHFGTERPEGALAPRFAAGELLPTIAVTEPESGGHVLGMSSTAVRDGGSYVLNGRKCFVGNSHIGARARRRGADRPGLARAHRVPRRADRPGCGAAATGRPGRAARLQLRRADLRGLPRPGREPDRRARAKGSTSPTRRARSTAAPT